MAEQQSGFRFDIYERVHLPETNPVIGELEQIELLPFVRGLPGAQQTELKGHLQLVAVYSPPEEGGEKQSFEHRIPVEISLPVRANAADGEIEVQIDQFDVELVSNRSMNVTGVLSLTGWNPHAEAAVDDKEEIVAVHEPRAGKPDSDPVQVITDSGPPASQETAAPVTETEEALQQTDTMPVWAPAAKSENDMEQPEDDYFLRETVAAEAPVSQDFLDVSEQPAVSEPVSSEPKVAFKPQTAEAQTPKHEGATAGEKKNNELEWRKLFFGGGEEQPFRKMKMCIVQKEETIQTIAERYRLNAREIALYNRLGEGDVSEGQILYIPSHS